MGGRQAFATITARNGKVLAKVNFAHPQSPPSGWYLAGEPGGVVSSARRPDTGLCGLS